MYTYDEYGNLVDEYGNVIQANPNQVIYGADGQPVETLQYQQYGIPSGPDSFQPLPEGINVGSQTEASYDPGSYAGANQVWSVPAPAAPSTLDKILGHAAASKDELKAIIDAWVAENGPKLQGAAAEADATQAGALGELNDLYGSTEAVGYHDPVAALTSEAAKAKADPAARQAQFDALGKLRGWTDPKVTAVEKFLQEQAREAEERDQRSHREATLRSMAARGVRSGGAEMAALLGGQQITSRNRLLSDLGTQAGAVQRALQATNQYGQQAATLAGQTFQEGLATGSATDAINKFNTEQTAAYQRDKTAHQVSERDKTVERGERKYNATYGAAADKFGRAGQLYDASWRPAAAKVGAAEAGNRGITDALTLALGAEEAEKARQALKGDEYEREWYEYVLDPGNLASFRRDDKSKLHGQILS